MIDDLLADAEKRMRHSIDVLKKDLANIRSGRATPGLVEHIEVEYYGVPTPLIQLASISVPEPRMIAITPWDPNSIGPIEKAIQKSELGLNPSNDGKIIRILVPPLTEERRRSLVKMVRQRVEEDRVAIRNIRRDVMNDIKQMQHEKMISEDEARRAQEKLQQLTDKYIKEADSLGEQKEQEILTV
ncbi:ribosome recycling factor [Thermobaculum terrenum ATCC BAA-798]|uniref:Ribosome-recycling factor n=1 Tax=Thermobaculum terrenum (strain ATCC BAA-798 / CCMEE 7001 / YNP1) TaxID=525904 RepID=D1CCA8_THET1|nr:ribosome recycling factor [Thermobaculum terrenum]ACZ42423.1 ribosome recycling factor [Thermobaculum terrenum ATCC BAA-798]